MNLYGSLHIRTARSSMGRASTKRTISCRLKLKASWILWRSYVHRMKKPEENLTIRCHMIICLQHGL